MKWLVLSLALLSTILAPTAVGAQTDVLPRSEEQIRLTFAPLVAGAAPAVVNIYTSRETTSRRVSPLFDDPFFQRFFGPDFAPGPRRRQQQNSLGSGVILRSDGLVMTNHHVIDDADSITVVLADGREYDATVIASEAATDLAALQLTDVRGALPTLELADSDTLQVGDLVLAIGNPFGVGQTVTLGIVSALARTTSGISDYSFFIQTDAAINPGNSGGALVDIDGRLVGINTAIYSRSGGSLGIGFAIPADMVRSTLESVDRGAPGLRPWLGADGQPVDTDTAVHLGLDRPSGVLISRVRDGSPAAEAGLEVGDVVLSVDGRPVNDNGALRYRIATLPVGERTGLEVVRGGETLNITVMAALPAEIPPRDTTVLEGPSPLAGAMVANLSPAVIAEHGFDGQTEQGVVVLGVERRSRAGRLGLRDGDVILAVNGVEIEDVATLRAITARPGSSWRIAVQRGNRILQSIIHG